MLPRQTVRCHLEQLERREQMATLADCLLPQDIGPERVGRVDAAAEEVVATAAAVQFPYADATVENINGVITIRGGSGNHWVSIYGSSVNYFINSLGAMPTTLQVRAGIDNNRVYYFDDYTAIDIDLGDGDDVVRVEGGLKAGLSIRTGGGNDEIVLLGNEESSVAVGFSIQEIPLRPLPVRGDLFIDTGDGDDQVSPYAKVSGDAHVQMGAGDDSYIEVPYRSKNSFEIGRLAVAGKLTIDLGTDQDVDNIPADWRSDPAMTTRVLEVLPILNYYQELLDRGEAQPGQALEFRVPGDSVRRRVDAQGRVEVALSYKPGMGQVIDRLIRRGVEVTWSSVKYGGGRAWIGMSDLNRLANLPGLNYLAPQGVYDNGTVFLGPIDEDVVSVQLPTSNGPVFGPARITDPQPGMTLEESYFRTGSTFGPQLF
ncbi:hypothetical protein [Anatilimnocola floriformis]|uniref:hypothetical protein n=1 Tax=Anatilimnocola floriformis TaxID=2948575 RepID=UPI0020C54FC6|nr:hypothetical protein [Anatilimnocola floriformis]